MRFQLRFIEIVGDAEEIEKLINTYLDMNGPSRDSTDPNGRKVWLLVYQFDVHSHWR